MRTKAVYVAHTFTLLWVLCIAIFFGILIYFKPTNGIYTESESLLLASVLISGVITFSLAILFYIIYFFRRKKPSESDHKKSNLGKRIFKSPFTYVSFLFVVILFLFSSKIETLNESINELQSNATNKSIREILQSITPIPTTQITQKYNNPDPIVNCGPGEHSRQYVKDNSSNCKNYVDCGLSNDTVWTMMIKSECDKKHAEEASKYNQSTQQNTGSSKKIPVFLSYWNSTVYCSPENVGAAYSINSTLEGNKAKDQQNYQACVSNFQQTNSCYNSCKTSSYQDSNFDYGSCIATCPSTADACNWVYSQSNSTRNQINNLCSWVSN